MFAETANVCATQDGAALTAMFRQSIHALESFVKMADAVKVDAFATLASLEPDAKSSPQPLPQFPVLITAVARVFAQLENATALIPLTELTAPLYMSKVASTTAALVTESVSKRNVTAIPTSLEITAKRRFRHLILII